MRSSSSVYEKSPVPIAAAASSGASTCTGTRAVWSNCGRLCSQSAAHAASRATPARVARVAGRARERR
ncbi:hypothetical protein GTX14_13730 [Streptomyces sp. SID4944]|nr:hypothetical protein [Streptomyces sp. SID4944]